MANPKHQAYLEQKKKELERRNFDLCERFKQGASDWEIAEEFKIGVALVRRILKEANLRIFKNEISHKYDKEAIRNDFKNGMRKVELGVKYKINQVSLNKILNHTPSGSKQMRF